MIVTNVPGPQFPLYVAGRRLIDVTPVAFLPRNHALALAIMSYDGKLNFGLLGDYDAVPDIDTISQALADGIADLVERAKRQNATPRGPKRTPAGAGA